jgi:hypothetical protein
MSDLLVSKCRPIATTRLSEWLAHNADEIGIRYRSELSLRA